MTNTLHDEIVTIFKYYFNVIEISFSEFLTQIESFQLKNHIVNQIIIRFILLLANMNSENNREKSIIIDFIKIINAAFTDKTVNLVLSAGHPNRGGYGPPVIHIRVAHRILGS